MVMPCRGCLHPQLYFIAALYTTFSRGRWPRLKAFFLVVRCVIDEYHNHLEMLDGISVANYCLLQQRTIKVKYLLKLNKRFHNKKIKKIVFLLLVYESYNKMKCL